MDKNELIAALMALDEWVVYSHEIVIVGGAAMVMQFGAHRITKDIDVIITDNEVKDVRDAAQKVAEDLELEGDWLNDGVKAFAGILPTDFHNRLILLDLGCKKLKLYVIGITELLTMKMAALREQDLEDIELLLPQIQEEDKKVVIENMNQLSKIRPDWAQKIYYFLAELEWKIE